MGLGGYVCATADLRPYHRFMSALSVVPSVADATVASLGSLLTRATDWPSEAADSTGELGIAVGCAARLVPRGALGMRSMKSQGQPATAHSVRRQTPKQHASLGTRMLQRITGSQRIVVGFSSFRDSFFRSFLFDEGLAVLRCLCRISRGWKGIGRSKRYRDALSEDRAYVVAHSSR
jgi:hypothetical protein